PGPAPSPPPAARPPASAPATKPLTEAELEAQRRERTLRAAMAAPIAATAFEARPSSAISPPADRTASGTQAIQPPSAAILPAAALAATRAAPTPPALAARSAAWPQDRPEVLPASLRGPVSRFEVKAGTIIPAVLITGVDSDLPGQ